MQIPFYVSLEDKVVVITGAGGILCQRMAMALAECGAKVALLDINKSSVDGLATQIQREGKEAMAIQADVLDKESLKRAHEVVLKTFGKCDLLINGAGGNHTKGTTTKEYLFEEDLVDQEVQTFFDLDDTSIQFVFNLNFLGTLLPTQEFAKDMIGRKGCSIINISSMNAFTPLTKIPAYSGAKAAVSNFTKWLAVHFSKLGIRVNALAPGFFLTKQNEKLLLNEDGSLTKRAHKIIKSTPMGRFGEPDELLGALLFLASEQGSGFVNGVVLPVDGAFSAYSGV
ncbi:MAG: SDR family oxidoreductase [Zhenhengia sp.]|uniref:SDR family oxidoreductase n=1 Tax=Zhenhengia sp. TaxID=2944208 RepID=UPI00399575C8